MLKTEYKHRHGVIVVVFVNYHILLNIQVANTCRWCTFHSGEAKASVWLHLCRKFALQNVGRFNPRNDLVLGSVRIGMGCMNVVTVISRYMRVPVTLNPLGFKP